MGFRSSKDFDGQFLSKLSGNLLQISIFMEIQIYIIGSLRTFTFRS